MSLTLSDQQAREILLLAGMDRPDVGVAPVKEHNHVFRLTSGDECFFLKTYTKDWYGGDVAASGGCVAHERSAWEILAARGLAAPEVVLACEDHCNPLGRPFIVTRRLRGTELPELLVRAAPPEFAALLRAAGEFLGRAHAITFRYPGYLMDPAGPAGPPEEGAWQHAIWSARQTQRWALDVLEQDRPRIAPALATELEALFGTIETALRAEFEPPRFTHGDCHAHQFFLYWEAGAWQVAGFVDMEVASAGDCVMDVLKFGVELASRFPATTGWWQPFFAGYGHEPDFELVRLRLLGWHEANWTCHGGRRTTREQQLRRLLVARGWEELFYA